MSGGKWDGVFRPTCDNEGRPKTHSDSRPPLVTTLLAVYLAWRAIIS